jgi:predicted ATPase
VADRDGPAFWVDLVPVRDSAGVVQATAEALGVEARSGRALEQALRDRLATEPDLVVLDNCEHVLDAVAELLSTPDARAATVVATSRERLGVAGERVYVVDPLGLPAAGTADVDAPAVQLFLTRARDAGVDLTGDIDVLRRVGEVCRALDGLPLALELGAARMGTLTIEDLAERLDRRFDLLTRGPRTAPRRHRTLRSVVDWSYDLLDEEERAVFTRLAVFPSGFDLAAAEAVVSDESVGPDRVADVVAQLADRSMVVRPSGVGKGKYRLLESLRQYAVSRLASEELARARRRHAVWAVKLAESARHGLEGPDEARWSLLLDDVLDDLRAAWRWSREAEEPETAERLLAATWRWAHWRFRADVLRWGAQLVYESPADAPLVAYTAAAGCAWLEGELDEVDRVAALAERRFEDDASRDDLFEILGDVSLWRGATARAAACYEKAGQIRRQEGDVIPQSIALSNEVLALVYAGRPWEQTVDEALALAVSTGNPTTIAFARYAEGEARADEDSGRAVTALEEALSLAESVGNRLITGVAMTALVALRGRTAAVEPATFELFRRVIVHWATTRNPALLVTALRNLVILLARIGRFEDSVELWSSIQSIDPAHPSYGAEAVRLDAALAAARDALGLAFDAAVVRGRGHAGITGVSAHALRLCEDESIGTAGNQPTGASTGV